MKPECRALLGRQAEDLWQRYFNVFLDNNESERQIFFSDPLIQHLWGLFRHDMRDEVLDYIQNVGATTQHDEATPINQNERFVRDIQNMELITGCNIMP